MFDALQRAFGEGSIALDVHAGSREDAILAVAGLLVASGRVSANYGTEMLEALTEFGPYFVLAPGIAIAHSRPSESVISSGLALLRLSEPIEFGSEHNDPVKLVFGLCAVDHEGHMDVLSQLAMYLNEPDQVKFLLNATSIEQIRQSFQVAL